MVAMVGGRVVVGICLIRRFTLENVTDSQRRHSRV